MDGAALDGDDGVEQWRLWCSGGASRGEARRCELQWCSGGCGDGVTVGSWRRRGYGQRDCGVVAVHVTTGGATTGGSHGGAGGQWLGGVAGGR
jgi:hypothetical protein